MFPGELTFPDDYVEIMDSGSVDDTFMEELAKLTPEQREYLTDILSDRRARRAGV